MMMGYSERCSDLQTYWNRTHCVPCNLAWLRPGVEFTPNCGIVDDGGRRDNYTKDCDDHHFNDGSLRRCQPCTTCPPGRETRGCDKTRDALCAPTREDCGQAPCSTVPTRLHEEYGAIQWNNALWLAPLITLLASVVLGASYFLYREKRKRRCFKGLIAGGNVALKCPAKGVESEVLTPQVHAAPLRLVLDDLDVLEELIILLDPEVGGVKCTRHLASYWNFPAAWINYTYSMRESKSPLKTVLEAVTTRNPDWTVGGMASLLGEMGRTDAVMVLAHLKVGEVRAF